MDIVACCVVLRILATHVAPEIHVSKDELVVLLRAPERVMDAWNGRSGLALIEEVRHSLVAVASIGKAFLGFLLPRRQMAVHKHEAAVVEVEAQGAGALVRSHSLHSCLDLHCFQGAETRLVEGVTAREKHDIAAKHDLLRNAGIGELVLRSVIQGLADERLPFFHPLQVL